VRQFVACVGAATLLVVTACSSGRDPETRRASAAVADAGCRNTGLVTEAQGGGGPGGPAIYWDEPTGGMGRSFDSVDAAAKAIPFRPLSPTRIEPCEVIVSGGPPPFLVLRFQDPKLGIFNVSQHKLQIPVANAERRQRALPRSCPRQPGCAGVYSLIRLADGRDGLLVLGRGNELATHNVSFVDRDRGIEVVIQGPPRTFDREDAVDVANAFVVAENR
jgi:hypothetical protein